MRFTATLFLVLVTTVLLGCRIEIEPVYGSYSTAGADGSVTMVQYGYSGERVYFVSFETEQGTVIPHAKVTVLPQPDGHNSCTGYITLPDGREQDLPPSHCVFEFTRGQFRSCPIKFTTSQLRAYLQPRPTLPTIDGLNHFINSSK